MYLNDKITVYLFFTNKLKNLNPESSNFKLIIKKNYKPTSSTNRTSDLILHNQKKNIIVIKTKPTQSKKLGTNKKKIKKNIKSYNRRRKNQKCHLTCGK